MHDQIRSDLKGLKGNELLAALAPDDAALIAQRLVRLHYRRGVTLFEPRQPIAAAIFPVSAVIGIAARGVGDRTVELGVVGHEGFVGWPLLLGSNSAGHQATVRLTGGEAWALLAADLIAAANASATLRAHLLGFVHAFMDQLGATLIAYAGGTAIERIARHLMILHERVDGDELEITHKEIAAMLCLRRPSVTDCLHLLEGEGAIRCWRGRIVVRDRGELARHARGVPRAIAATAPTPQVACGFL